VDGAGRGRGHFSSSEGGGGYYGDCTGGNKLNLPMGTSADGRSGSLNSFHTSHLPPPLVLLM